MAPFSEHQVPNHNKEMTRSRQSPFSCLATTVILQLEQCPSLCTGWDGIAIMVWISVNLEKNYVWDSVVQDKDVVPLKAASSV